MGRLIEESKVLEILQTSWLNGTVAHRIIDEIKQRIKLETPTVEAIPKADYEARLKSDMTAMLTELLSEIEEMQSREDWCDYATDNCIDRCGVDAIIRLKINALKAESEEV